MDYKGGITTILIFLCTLLQSQNLPVGSLVIVGGGLENNNKSIFTQLIDLAGGAGAASFAIIPSASGVSVQSFEYFKKALVSYGVKPEKINLIPIAMVDDDSTKDVNEATWSNNGNDPKLAEIVRKCSAVWFSGGDQARTIKTLVKPDGSRTVVLEAVWDVFNKGGVVGGTSAGAAIMSEAMICAGNSLGALTHGAVEDYKGDDFPESEGVLMAHGLGFFPLGIVDQHFNARARIGRLIVALFHENERFKKGFGIDENTALIYLGKEKKLRVAGAGGVTFINTEEAQIRNLKKMPEIYDLLISYLEDGDSFDIRTGLVIPADGKKQTCENEYYNIKDPGQSGIFTGYSSGFRELITKNLIDNKGTNEVKNLSFFDKDKGYMVTLRKTPDSKGFYTDKPDGEDHYTVINIRMDITPVKVEITPIK